MAEKHVSKLVGDTGEATRDRCKVDLERHGQPAPPHCVQCATDDQNTKGCPFWRRA